VAATLAFALLLAVWSVAVPIGDAPDETSHADLVFHLATGAAYPRYNGRHVGAALSQLCLQTTAATRACPREGEVVSRTSVRPHTARNAPARGSLRDFNEAGGDREIGPFNQMLQHPPLYYWTMSGLIRSERFALPGSGLPPLIRELALLRLANVLLIAPLPILAWWACRRLGLADDVGVAAALVPFAVPQLLHIGSTLNNDNLLTLLVAALTGLLAGVVRGDLSRRTAAAVGVITGLALLTKAFALVLPIAVVFAYGLGWRRTRPRSGQRRDAAVAVAVAGVVSAGLGGWWYVRNLARGDGVSPSTENARLNTTLRPRGFHADPWIWARRFVSLFTERFWGAFGWYTVRISLAAVSVATVVLIGALSLGFVGIGRAPRSSPLASDDGGAGPRRVVRPVGRIDLMALLLPAALLVVFVLVRSWSLYAKTGQFSFIQGRYVFAAVVGIAAVAAVGAQRLMGRRAALATLGLATIMQAEGLRRVLSGYWGPGGGGPADQVRALVAWSPWPTEVLVLGALAFLAATAWLGLEVARTARRAVVLPAATSNDASAASVADTVAAHRSTGAGPSQEAVGSGSP